MSTFFFSRKISLNIRSELNSELRELLKILIQIKESTLFWNIASWEDGFSRS